MKKNKLLSFAIISVSLLFATSSCTNLDESMYSRISSDNFYNNRDEVVSAVLRPYTHARAWAAPTGQNGCWRLNEYSADQIAWPTKGRHGYDGGDWIRLHYHTWNIRENTIGNTWRLMFWGMGLCTDAANRIASLDPERMGITQEEKDQFVAEMKVFRAYHYLRLMDLFGNIPVVTEIGTPVSPPTVQRTEVFKFIEKELLDNVDKLPLLSSANNGRVTRAAGYAMLAELYINAEIWSGTQRYDDCIKACDYILQNKVGSQTGVLALDQDIKTPFCNTNSTTSNENLFVLAYDYQGSINKCGWNGDFYHFAQKYIYGGASNGNNGGVVIPSAYNNFDAKDLRKSTWMLIGPQYYYDDPTKPVLGTEEYKNKPLVFVNYIYRASEGKTESTMYNGEENSGARFNKYQPGPSTDPHYWSNDWALYRLTEIKYFKAEALMRKNAGSATQEAVDLVNECRIRDYSSDDWAQYRYTTSTLTLDELINDRAREFIFEGKRRTDLIRFGKFVSTNWWDHTASNDKNLEIFPIPYNQLASNPNLKQNPGYPSE